MKLVLLLGLCLLGAYAETAPKWDLSTISQDDVPTHTEVNQGYTARYSQAGKSLKLSLTVHKEKSPRVTDSDRLLFGMEAAPASVEAAMANVTLAREDTAAIIESSLGADWETMVRLPAEDLSYVEVLRLAASLNEYNLVDGGNTRKARGSPAGYDCICHGTPHHFPAPHGVDAPYWGVRVLQRRTRYTNPGHAPYGNRDCVLCDHNEINQPDTETGFEYDCRWCCSGECVVGTGNESPNSNYPGWDNCDYDFQYDQIRSDASDPSFNYFKLNDVGTCRLPRVYHCEEEVERYCQTCEPFLEVLTAEAEMESDTDWGQFNECKFCDLVVGANPYICQNCSHAMSSIERYGDLGSGFRGESTCSCEYAMWQIANSPAQKHRNPQLYWTPPAHHESSHESAHEYAHEVPEHPAGYAVQYDYGSAFRADYDYSGNDYDYAPRVGYDYRIDYDFTPQPDYAPEPAHDYRYPDYDYVPDYDYARVDYDYVPQVDYDYRPAYDYGYSAPADYARVDYDYAPQVDYDYRPAYDYGYSAPADYARVDYDYAPQVDYDYRPVDYTYDYRPVDYDYYAPAYGYDYDYRPVDYDYRPADYDYRPADYDYRPVDYTYDYRPADYDYAPRVDYDYRPVDYDYDYLPVAPAHDYDYEEGDHYEAAPAHPLPAHAYDYDYAAPVHHDSYDYIYTAPDYAYDYDYDYRPRDYDYVPAHDYDYVPAHPAYRPVDYRAQTGSLDYSRPHAVESHEEGDHYESHESAHYVEPAHHESSYDYDYAPPTYDYTYVRPQYDYVPVQHEGDHYESHDYDYSPPTYDYTYVRPQYDYDYRPVDYDYRPVDYDYRPAYDYDYRA